MDMESRYYCVQEKLKEIIQEIEIAKMYMNEEDFKEVLKAIEVLKNLHDKYEF